MGRLVDTDDILRICDKFLTRYAVDMPNKYFDRQGVRLVVEKLCEQAPNAIEPMKNGRNYRLRAWNNTELRSKDELMSR